MTCDEFERVLPELEGDRSSEQEQHLRTCPACSDLVSDLNVISQQAKLLAEDREPSPRVWNSIEIALRQEGLVHQPPPQSTPFPARAARWSLAWLAPAAAFVLIFGALIYQRGTGRPEGASQVVPGTAGTLPQPVVSAALADEEQLLKLVAARVPAQRAGYESDLRAVDAYIRDAERSAKSNPNDEIAQQYLVSAYEQKAMVYEIAMDPALR